MINRWITTKKGWLLIRVYKTKTQYAIQIMRGTGVNETSNGPATWREYRPKYFKSEQRRTDTINEILKQDEVIDDSHNYVSK